jgi:hypothetical protein
MSGSDKTRKSPVPDVTGLVPTGLRVSAALAWRFIVVIAALYVIVWLASFFAHLLVPVAIALLLAALMAPGVDRLIRWGAPRWAAAVIVMVAGIALLGGLLTFVVITFVNGLPELQAQVLTSLDQIRDWLTNGPLHLRAEQIQSVIDDAIGAIQDNQAAITQGAITTATTIGEVLTGFLLTVFILIFFLYDGPGIWRFVTRGVPERVDVAGRRGFAALVNYVRATAAVALVDAVGIGIGLADRRRPAGHPAVRAGVSLRVRAHHRRHPRRGRRRPGRAGRQRLHRRARRVRRRHRRQPAREPHPPAVAARPSRAASPIRRRARHRHRPARLPEPECSDPLRSNVGTRTGPVDQA